MLFTSISILWSLVSDIFILGFLMLKISVTYPQRICVIEGQKIVYSICSFFFLKMNEKFSFFIQIIIYIYKTCIRNSVHKILKWKQPKLNFFLFKLFNIVCIIPPFNFRYLNVNTSYFLCLDQLSAYLPNYVNFTTV